MQIFPHRLVNIYSGVLTDHCVAMMTPAVFSLNISWMPPVIYIGRNAPPSSANPRCVRRCNTFYFVYKLRAQRVTINSISTQFFSLFVAFETGETDCLHSGRLKRNSTKWTLTSGTFITIVFWLKNAKKSNSRNGISGKFRRKKKKLISLRR